MADLITYRLGFLFGLIFSYLLVSLLLVASIPFSLYYTLFKAKPK